MTNSRFFGSTPPRVVLALLAVQLLFGINYIASKIVLERLEPLVWADVRLVAATFCLLVFALVTRRPHPKPTRVFFKSVFVYSVFGAVINQTAFLAGLSLTTPVNSAILVTLTPLMTLMIAWLRRREARSPSRLAGFLLGLAGAILVRGWDGFRLSDATLWGDLLTILNCLSYACFLALSEGFTGKNDAVWTTIWVFIFGSFMVTLMALPGWMRFTMPELDPVFVACGIFVVVGATVLTYLLNLWSLSRVRSSEVASFIYLQPVIAAIVSFLALGSRIPARAAIGAVLIYLGLRLARGGPGIGNLRRRVRGELSLG